MTSLAPPLGRSATPNAAIPAAPPRFGRRGVRAAAPQRAAAAASDDLRQFLTAFAGGLVFFSILIF